MKQITITVSKADVLKEVAQTTSYVGAKMKDDSEAYDRIYTTDENAEMLERFWQETKNLVITTIREWLVDEKEEDGTFTVNLRVASLLNDALLPTIERTLFSYFVMSITGKWFTLTNRDDVEAYSTQAAAFLQSVRQLLFSRKRPERPTY